MKNYAKLCEVFSVINTFQDFAMLHTKTCQMTEAILNLSVKVVAGVLLDILAKIPVKKMEIPLKKMDLLHHLGKEFHLAKVACIQVSKQDLKSKKGERLARNLKGYTKDRVEHFCIPKIVYIH